MKKEFGILNKKAVVGFQLGLLIVSLFAFSYMIYSAGSVFAETKVSQRFK